MKIKIQFGEEHVEEPNTELIKTWVRLLPNMRRSLRMLAMSEPSARIKRRID